TSFEELPDLLPAGTTLALSRHPEMTPEQAAALLKGVIAGTGDRIKVSGDILDFVEFFEGDDDFPLEEKAWNKRLVNDPAAVPLLKEFREKLAAVPASGWTPASLESLFMSFIEEKQVKPAQLIHALRVASTGKGVGIGMFEALELLGPSRTLKRIDRVLNLLNV
ncbi:MAG: hypothetical protein J6S40_03105, partial [Thermoguttaceae bacterium]|nr:hypothetical protein [Thermoguttaceae bacterium]